ncbi:MAG: beta-ketoacyl-ACP synthase III [Planctomycetota bacterium]
MGSFSRDTESDAASSGRSDGARGGLRTSLTGVQILGTGYCTPGRVVTNEELARHGYDSAWIEKRTGIVSRHVADADQATSDLATVAARQCIEGAGLTPSEVGLIIVATMTTDHATPTSANIVQANLGCSCPALDVNVACSGFVYSLVTAAQFLFNGSCRNALVIGAEKMTYMADPQNMKTFPLFGDGAGAVLVGSENGGDPSSSGSGTLDPPGILAYKLMSLGEQGQKLVVPSGGSRDPISVESVVEGKQYLHMDGKAVFKWAVKLVPEIIDEILSMAGLKRDDVDLILMHQANRRIIDAVVQNSGVAPEKVYVNVDRFGNTSAASIPIALHECMINGRIDPGSIVLMIGFGGGLSWGGCVFRW